jgi:hypothetical protein
MRSRPNLPTSSREHFGALNPCGVIPAHGPGERNSMFSNSFHKFAFEATFRFCAANAENNAGIMTKESCKNNCFASSQMTRELTRPHRKTAIHLSLQLA